MVPAAQIYNAFDLRVATDLPEFKPLTAGRHFFTIDSEVTHLLRLRPLKGAMYVVSFGVLLSFVPIESGGALRRARVSARTNATLWDEPWTEKASEGPGERLRRIADPLSDTDLIGGVHNLNGMGFVEYTLDHHWRQSLPQMRAWFSANSSLESVLQTARTQLEEEGAYSTHYPNQRLVVAYLLARLGRADEARVQLEAWSERASTALPAKWQENLERVIADTKR
ncbi:MAG: hypothetical protein K2P58_00750 [Hyphomonadaceae bacterium]|nr:hypothetical protein [Hyphomonadaceae bacterium]